MAHLQSEQDEEGHHETEETHRLTEREPEGSGGDTHVP